LDVAASNGQVDALRFLLLKGEEFEHPVDTVAANALDSDGNPLLHRVAWHGHLESSGFLLALRADISASDGEGATALHRAASQGHLPVAAHLIASRADPLGKIGDKETLAGVQPMHLAALGGHVELLGYLNARGAAPDMPIARPRGSSSSHRPVDFASLLGHSSAVMTLRMLAGEPAEEIAANHASLEGDIVAADKILQQACAAGDLNVVEDLLDKEGANVSSCDHGGLSALHHAALGGHAQVAQHLILRAGADPAGGASAPGANRGVSPVHMAALGGHVHMLQLLVGLRADPHAVDRGGLGLQAWAALGGHSSQELTPHHFDTEL